MNEERLKEIKDRIDFNFDWCRGHGFDMPTTELELYNEVIRLRNGYCELKVKCNEGVSDCLFEEYEGMAECNMEISNRINDAIEYIEQNEFYLDYKTGACIKGVMPLLNILRGEDK